MNKTAAVLIPALALAWTTTLGQPTDPAIDSLVQRVEVDSLESYLRVLTGLDSVEVADSVLVYWADSLENIHTSWYADTVVALSRRVQMGNEVARYWLVRKLRSFGFTEVENDHPPDSPWIQNIWVEKTGRTRPDRIFILCAHYDAVPASPGADDNGSGTAAVLEAARLLRTFETKSTIVFALWDAEEIGLVGSTFFAQNARDNDLDIAGVVNLDMIGWDGDGDRVTEFHGNEQSAPLVDVVRSVMLDYELDLWPVNHVPGSRRSDHASFWNADYPAVLLIEQLYGGDFNPYYHSENDLLENVDLSYLVENARLALASIATLAGRAVVVANEPDGHDFSVRQTATNWPNPFSSSTNIGFSAVSGPATIEIFDIRGRLVKTIEWFVTHPGRQTVTWSPPNDLADGAFVYRVRTASAVLNGMMLLAR